MATRCTPSGLSQRHGPHILVSDNQGELVEDVEITTNRRREKVGLEYDIDREARQWDTTQDIPY